MVANKRTLLLNSDNTVSNVISYRDSITGWLTNKYHVISYYDETIRSAGGQEFSIPAVVISSAYNRRKKIRCTSYNLYLRDSGRCLYCLKKIKFSEMTKDHIIPKIKGGKSNWTNLASACSSCNSRKADKLWTPKIKAWEPTNIIQLYKVSDMPKEWEPYAVSTINK
jgi:hypothetical protein